MCKEKTYVVEMQTDTKYYHTYFWTSKNEFNQIIRCELSQFDIEKQHFNFSFCIVTKRKQGFPDGEITGKDGIKSLFWARCCLIDAMEYLKKQKGTQILFIGHVSKRKFKIYKRTLLPLGFQITQNKQKEFYIQL